MRPVRSLLIYLLFVFIGGALLAPWLHALVQQLQGHFPAMENFARYPFHRYVNRSLLVLAVLGLWPLLRNLGVNSLSELGFSAFRVNWRKLLAGFGIGLISLAAIAGAATLFDARELKGAGTAEAFFTHLFKATSAAIVVALLEETLFRGAIFGAFRKMHSWKTALVLSSAIYALVHFFAKPPLMAEVNWASGFVTLGQMLRGFADFQVLVPGFLNLFLAGAILAAAFQFTGNLYFSIGLHAGWIFWLKSYGFFTREVPGANLWFWGTTKLIDGWAALIVLALVFAVAIVRRKTTIQKIPLATCPEKSHQK